MVVKRLEGIPGFSIDRVAKEAGDDPEVLRMENLDTDILPPPGVVETTIAALKNDDCNSYLPFTGNRDLCRAVSSHVQKLSGRQYDSEKEVVITCGGTEAMLDTLLAVIDVGDEVILTDPTYAGMINRVRLAGGKPVLVPFYNINNEWRLDLHALKAAVSYKTKAFFIMSPSMPSGALLNRKEWQAIADICLAKKIWLIYDAAMERIIFDCNEYIHPASLPGMGDYTITLGSVSKEFRMIGWRVGWIVGPEEVMKSIALTHIYNVVTPIGIAQPGAMTALTSDEDDFDGYVKELEKRRNVLLEELRELPVIPSAGGWSLLLNVGEMGYDSFTASQLLLEKGKIAATPMRDWGKVNSDGFVRLVYSNEPIHRLKGIREKIVKSLHFPPMLD